MTPFHKAIRSLEGDLAETEVAVEPLRAAEIMHVKAHRLLPHRRLETKPRHDDAADAAPAIFRQDRDFEHAHLVVAVIDIEAPDRLARPLDDAIVRGVVVREIEAMLRIVLLRHDLVIEVRLTGLQQRCELPMPGGLVDALEKRLAPLSRGAQRNIRGIARRHW